LPQQHQQRSGQRKNPERRFAALQDFSVIGGEPAGTLEFVSAKGARRSTGRLLFLAALVIYSVCPPFTSFDSYWTVPTALSLIEHGSTAADNYVAAASPMAPQSGMRAG
jgi:hypothetical protein